MVIVKKKENKFDKILLVNYSVTLLISPIMPAIYKKKLRQYNSFLQFTLRQLIQKTAQVVEKYRICSLFKGKIARLIQVSRKAGMLR